MAFWAFPSRITAFLGVSYPFGGLRSPKSSSFPLPPISPPLPPSLSSELPCSRLCFNRFSFARARSAAVGDGGSPSFGAEPPATAVTEAREAVVEMLREFGASKEDSWIIASNSPKYMEMLVENVQELDELCLWESWIVGMGEERVDASSLDFRKKVYYMARSKKDGGILPFLENLGVKLSTAMLIARYLSSEKLPQLIDKVNFVKEILFSSNSSEGLLARNARRMMMHISIPIDEDVQVTLSFFEKMEARQGGLSMLGHEGSSFRYLIESFPKLLLRSVEEHFKPLVDFLEQIGIPKAGISFVLLLYPPIIFYDIKKNIKPKLRTFLQAGVEEKDIGRMLLKYPWILSSSIQENYERIITFFNERKVPKSSIDLAIRSWPHLLGCSPSKMKPIIEKFDELGVNKKKLVPVITSSPQLLLRKPDELIKVISFMEGIGFDSIITGQILCRCPEIFASNVENTLQRKINFLIDYGISRNCISRVIKKYPELLLLDTDTTLLSRINFFIEAGLSKKEVCSMICRFSPLLGYSIDIVLKPKLEFLLRVMRKPLREVVEYPRYFSYSLDKRIKPRFLVLRNRSIKCSLKDMLAKNDDFFAQEYMGIGRLLVAPSPVSSQDGS